MALSTRKKKVQQAIGQEDRAALLSVLSTAPSITIEELLQELPWMQWGYIFSILSECHQKGLVAFSQNENDGTLRIWIMPVSYPNKKKQSAEVKFPSSRSSSHYLTCS